MYDDTWAPVEGSTKWPELLASKAAPIEKLRLLYDNFYRQPEQERANQITRGSGESVLQEAQRLVYGDRQDDYGDALVEAERIAAGWSVIMGTEVSPDACALCMVWLKITRQLNKPKRDNLVDGAGYFAVAEKIEDARAEAEYVRLNGG